MLSHANHGGEGGSLVRRKPMHDEAKFDITAMIDLVFMMNIYFLVTMITAALAEIDLPVARHCVPADRDASIIVSLLANPDGGDAQVYVGEAGSGDQVWEQADQERQIRAAVEAGVAEKKSTVLIKAEKNVKLRDVARIGGWAASAVGIELKVSVIEKE